MVDFSVSLSASILVIILSHSITRAFSTLQRQPGTDIRTHQPFD